jgi:hypothetical protein
MAANGAGASPRRISGRFTSGSILTDSYPRLRTDFVPATRWWRQASDGFAGAASGSFLISLFLYQRSEESGHEDQADKRSNSGCAG